jgi:hypothetical protein
MFWGATAFNQPLNDWTVDRVTNMKFMFAKAASFNQPLDRWVVLNVTNMSSMFWDAQNFNQALAMWDLNIDVDLSGVVSFSGLITRTANPNLEELRARWMIMQDS